VVEECPSDDEALDLKAGFNLNEDLDDALYQMSVNVLAKLKPNMQPTEGSLSALQSS
jgi:hypothetical protein